jgi:Right handed beta helix region
MSALISGIEDEISQLNTEGTASHSSVDLTGRVISVKNIESKPALNGAYGMITAYDRDKDRYMIQLLDYSSPTTTTTLSMKYEKLIVLAPRRYHDSTNYSYNFNWEQYMTIYPHQYKDLGIGVINVPSGISSLDSLDPQICLLSPCLFRGVPSTTLCDQGYHMPSSCIYTRLNIWTSETIEIENILFTSPKDSVYISEGQLVFRQCRFRGARQGICTMTDETTVRNDNLNIIFENCVFDSNVCGAIIDDGTKATFLHCHFINHSFVGIMCRRTAIVSTFTNNTRALSIADKYTNCKVSYCSVINTKERGIHIIGDSEATLNHCLIAYSAECGVLVDGSSLHAIKCTFEESADGLQLHFKCRHVELNSCIIANNKRFGISVHIAFIGEVLINNCHVHSNGFNDIENDGLSKCKVLIDGIVFPTNGQTAEEYHSNPSNSSNMLLIEGTASIILRGQRGFKSAGIIFSAPTCGHCSKLEPSGTRFDKCSVCMVIVYCTKECQVLSTFTIMLSFFVKAICILSVEIRLEEA